MCLRDWRYALYTRTGEPAAAEARTAAADRAVAADSIEILASAALMLYALFSGRSIYLDVALVVALLGYIGTVLIARYLEGRL